MSIIRKAMQVVGLSLDPPIDEGIRLSKDMQQTLALLCAYGIDKRIVLRASESGVLNVTSARIKDIVYYTGVGASDTQTGDDVPCTECLVMAHPDNTGKVWVRPGGTAATNNSWPLAAGEVVNFTLDNLKQLSMLMVTEGDIVIVAYSR